MGKGGTLRQTSDVSPYERGRYPATDDNLENFIRNWERYQKRLIVFLGAGASVGAVNQLGLKLPQAYDLRNEIFREFLLKGGEREDYDFSNLGLLSLEHVAALAEAGGDRRTIEEFVAKRFFVKKPLWQHAVLPFLKPHAVFTTNYDNLIEMGWRLQDGRDDVKPLKPLFKETSRLSDDFVPLYKSHGTVDSPHEKPGRGGLVISQFDYSEMIPHRKEMLGQFASEFNEYCLLFIGYSFMDVDLASTLYEIRQDRSGRNWYAVFPRDNSDVREMYRERYKISQVNRRFHDFLRDLDEDVNFIPDEWKFNRIEELVASGAIYGEEARAARKGSAKKKR